MRNPLKKNFQYIPFLILSWMVITTGCSTKKNTWLSRNYQDITTRFNVYYNGEVSYEEGLKNIDKANKEDYSAIIPMYPISHHSNANAATTNMDRTIEKCRKAIKLHSIKVKPDKDYRKMNEPGYKLFYNQEEFNPALRDAWILLGKAEFHKADFLGAAGTFSYIARHYSSDRYMMVTSQLWIVRSYAEMGWIYEAEQMLSRVRQDDLDYRTVGLFASVNADLLLKRHLYKEAIPFLQLALSKEKDVTLKQRFTFLLGQLLEKTGDRKAAYNAFSRVIKMNPPYEMDFYARINRAQLEIGNVAGMRKELNKMLKNSNNKEYLDQVYFALGNTYIQQGDTAKAIENYQLSIAKSTRNGMDKAITEITLGDIYYKQRKYVLAQPCYDDASKILPNDNEDYDRVSRLSETLGDLVVQYNTVMLQDSLQHLASLPESQRIEVVNAIIRKLIADEKAAAEKAKQDAQNLLNNNEMSFAPPIGMNVPNGTGDWYFYNPEIVKSGNVEFIKKWGRRKLEDNWRRVNKSVSTFADNGFQSKTDTVTVNSGTKDSVVSDDKKPEFYLRQIPVTPAQILQSNQQIADALFAMGGIYKDKIQDEAMAISTYKEFIQRFGTDERVPDAYFQLYLIAMKNNHASDAAYYRQKLISSYPGTKYAEMLSNPNYASQMEKMYQMQDSLYAATYKAYNESNFNTVFKNVTSIQKSYPYCTLMPKFLFLNALSIGKTQSPEKFRVALDSLVTKYPQSDVTSMAKDILALIKQGKEAKKGTTGGALLEKRDEEYAAVDSTQGTNKRSFSDDLTGKHRVLFICRDSLNQMYKLQYNIAAFNFSRFLIKDFNLALNGTDSTQYTLSVTGLESYNEAQWYLNTLNTDQQLSDMLSSMKAQVVIISEDNYALLRTGMSLDDYEKFIASVKSRPVVPEKQNSTSGRKQNADNSGRRVTTPVAKNEPVPQPKVENTEKQVTTPPSKTETVAQQPTPVTPPSAAGNKTVPENQPKPESSVTTPNNVPKTQETVKSTPPAPVVKPKEDVPLFKGLYGYRAKDPQFIAIDVLSGQFDFNKVKADFDAYNSQNYAIMNLKVSMETINNQQVIIIGSFPDAQVAKSYLLRMVKQRSLYDGLKNANYRNLVGTQENLNIAVQQSSLDTYFEFMQQYYLK